MFARSGDGTLPDFRSDVDPTEFYISIVGLGYFFLSNKYTLGIVFDAKLTGPEPVAARREHVIDVVLGYLRNTSETSS